VRPKDNSDATILIFSDYLEEIGLIEEAQEVREQINVNIVNHYAYSATYTVGTPGYQEGVGNTIGNFVFEFMKRVGPNAEISRNIGHDTGVNDIQVQL
jgi:hypothetical protein